MGLRFRKSFKVAPGVRLNVGTRGASWTVGAGGYSVNFGSRGTYANYSLPGTGLSYRGRTDSTGGSRQKSSSDSETIGVTLCLLLDGKLGTRVGDGYEVLSAEALRTVKKQAPERVLTWLAEQSELWNEELVALTDVHLKTPSPLIEPKFLERAFDALPPPEPALKPVGFLASLFEKKRQRIEEENAQLRKSYEKALATYQVNKEAFYEKERRRKEAFDNRGNSQESVLEFMSTVVHGISWCRETNVELDISEDAKALTFVCDLPEIEDFPSERWEVNQKSFCLKKLELSQTDLRKAYMQHIHGVAMRLVGEAFMNLPSIERVTFSGFSQRTSKSTGQVQDEFLLSVRVEKRQWTALNFGNLEAVDPVECLGLFDLRRDMTKTGIFKAIKPFIETSPPGTPGW